MFNLENSFVSAIINNEKNEIKKYDLVNKIVDNGLLEKISLVMTDNELYHDSVAKWFFRLNDTFDSIQKIQTRIAKYKFTRKLISSTYSKLLKSINDYNIYLASYHDLILHFLVVVLQIEIHHKNITWTKVEKYCSDIIKDIMEKMYELLDEEIKYRNSSLHDFDYSWIEKYFSYETIRLINIMRFRELNELLEPLQKTLVYNANLELTEIKVDAAGKIDMLENITYDLFKELKKIYEEKV